MWGCLGTVAIIAGLIAIGPIGWIILGIWFVYYQFVKEEEKKSKNSTTDPDPEIIPGFTEKELDAFVNESAEIEKTMTNIFNRYKIGDNSEYSWVELKFEVQRFIEKNQKFGLTSDPWQPNDFPWEMLELKAKTNPLIGLLWIQLKYYNSAFREDLYREILNLAIRENTLRGNEQIFFCESYKKFRQKEEDTKNTISQNLEGS